MANVKRSPKTEKQDDDQTYADPVPGSVKDPVTGRYSIPERDLGDDGDDD